REIAIIWTSVGITCVPASLAALALAVFAGPLATQVMRLPAALQDEAVFGLRLAAVGFVARSISGVLNTPQLVRLRMDLSTWITAGMAIVQHCLVIAMLVLGGGFAGSVAVVMSICIATALVNAVVSRRLLPRLYHVVLDRALIAPLLRFGVGVVLSSLAAM